MKNEIKMQMMGWLSKWSDTDLDELRTLLNEETHTRERKRKEARKNWIDNHYNQFKCCYGDYKVIGNTVVIALAWMGNVKMATATAIKGDVFDLRTGIAVAYAKACGERIPNSSKANRPPLVDFARAPKISVNIFNFPIDKSKNLCYNLFIK